MKYAKTLASNRYPRLSFCPVRLSLLDHTDQTRHSYQYMSPDMLRSVYFEGLSGHRDNQWRGTFDLRFEHQLDKVSLLNAPVNCFICRSLLNELLYLDKKDLKHQNIRTNLLSGPHDFLGRWLHGSAKLNIAEETDRAAFISAHLSELPELGRMLQGACTFSNKIYRLDFKLCDVQRSGTFVLDQISQAINQIQDDSCTSLNIA